MELAIVIRPQNVVQILVMNDRLNEERRDMRSVQRRMDANLTGDVIVRTEADAAPRLPLDLLTPSNVKRRIFEKIGSMHLGRE